MRRDNTYTHTRLRGKVMGWRGKTEGGMKKEGKGGSLYVAHQMV